MKLITIIFFIIFFHYSIAKNTQFESGNTQNTLVELYTSEGCSSCPPAEKWLNNLKNYPKLWSEVVPVAFHVDYWDYIGWHDSFAKKEFSNRQRQHYLEKNLSQVYTPAILKNGIEHRTWRYVGIGSLTAKNVGKLKANVVDDKVYISFSQKKFDAHIALLGFGFKNNIKAGENENKVLNHDFVILAYDKKTTNNKQISIKIPSSAIKSDKLALAVWVTKTAQLKPIQVTGGWL